MKRRNIFKASELSKLAERQAGYFTSKQALSLGYSLHSQLYHCRKGNWVSVSKGLYRLPGYSDTLESEFIRWTLWPRAQKDHPQIGLWRVLRYYRRKYLAFTS